MSTEYDVRKALEAAEEGLRKQGLKLPDKATIQAYAKSNNMSEAEAIENIEARQDRGKTVLGRTQAGRGF